MALRPLVEIEALNNCCSPFLREEHHRPHREIDNFLRCDPLPVDDNTPLSNVPAQLRVTHRRARAFDTHWNSGAKGCKVMQNTQRHYHHPLRQAMSQSTTCILSDAGNKYFSSYHLASPFLRTNTSRLCGRPKMVRQMPRS